MNFGGFQKTSLLDYPDQISAIVWTISCNFRCPFCYNKHLVEGKVEPIPEEEVLSFLKKRKGKIDALSISGGEPLLHKELIEFIKRVKKIGYLVKVDTNGTFPDRLKKLIDEKLLDYISMDVKTPKKKYSQLTGVKTDIKKIEKSINIIKNSNVEYEFKTTFVPKMLNKEDIFEIGKWLEGSERYYLQQFKNDTPVISQDLQKVSPYPKNYLLETLESIKPFYKNCEVRGI